MLASDGKLVELQVRTDRQNVWANISESLADSLDPEVKYGGGPADVREHLDQLSENARLLDTSEDAIKDTLARAEALREQITESDAGSAESQVQLDELDDILAALRESQRAIDRDSANFKRVGALLADAFGSEK